jgi:murein DD-endopeptidase MepM/ murein hydrolase activator NlpD
MDSAEASPHKHRKPTGYSGRHRPSAVPRVAVIGLAAATIIGVGLTAASAAPSAVDPAPAVADDARSAEDRAGRDSTRDQTAEPPAAPPPSEEPTLDKPSPPAAEKEKKKKEEAPSWVRPSPAEVSDTFGPRAWRGGEMHNGLDFAASEGQENVAASAGVVVQAGGNGGYGLSITIDHGNGVETLYGHHSQLMVQVGDMVAAGDVIGLAGSTGDVTGPHLHFEVHVDGEPVDPQPYLRDQGVQL